MEKIKNVNKIDKNDENLKSEKNEEKRELQKITKQVVVNNIPKEEKVKLTINYIEGEKLNKEAEELNFLSMRLGDIRNLQDCKNLKV